MQNHEKEFEINNLNETLEEIASQLALAQSDSRTIRETLTETQRDMWEEVSSVPTSVSDLDELVQAKTYLDEIKNQQVQLRFTRQQINKLTSMQYAPYFGRIDFCEDGGNTERIYIGIGTVANDDLSRFYVYDWRAPVSGIFYDFENGRAH